MNDPREKPEGNHFNGYPLPEKVRVLDTARERKPHWTLYTIRVEFEVPAQEQAPA